jgi:adenylate kinase
LRILNNIMEGKKNNPKHLNNFKEFVKEFGDIDGKENLEEIPCIIITGPPGCGKGTQANIISKGMRWKHISTGDILRRSSNKEIKKMMKTGGLLPDDLVGKELIDYLKEYSKHHDPRGFIFDGYPRNLTQKDIFEEICRVNKLNLVYVFFLNGPEELLKKRIVERGKSSGRADDKSEKAFNKRMEEYNEQTLPMIESMRNGSNFLEISANRGLDQISDLIFKRLNEI